MAALLTSQRITSTTKAGTPTLKRIGTALSYRFVRDDKGWRVFVSCQAQAVNIQTSASMGAVGVDVNADHLAVSELDRFGNLATTRKIDLHTYGKSTDQAKALIGDAVGTIVAQAKTNGKPVVIEKLNFQKKKAELESVNRKQARLLSSFACNKVASGLKAAAFRAGVEVIEVNPAYTSVIGAVNHAQQKGVSVHQGAALAIARRGLGLSERSAVSAGIVPTGNGGHVTFELPCQGIAWKACVVVLVEGSRESQSSACSALPVRGSSKRPATSDPGNAVIGCYLVFHGAIAWCESSATLFG